jgi:hypothetical protein
MRLSDFLKPVTGKLAKAYVDMHTGGTRPAAVTKFKEKHQALKEGYAERINEMCAKPGELPDKQNKQTMICRDVGYLREIDEITWEELKARIRYEDTTIEEKFKNELKDKFAAAKNELKELEETYNNKDDSMNRADYEKRSWQVIDRYLQDSYALLTENFSDIGEALEVDSSLLSVINAKESNVTGKSPIKSYEKVK